MKDVLGGKGAGLAEMTNLGIPVPPGFTIASSLCITYLETRQFPPWLRPQVETSARSGSRRPPAGSSAARSNPLLVSVRSGAAVSMPGMMETILNLGLNDETVAGLATAERQRRRSPGTPTAASSRCTARSSSTCPRRRSRSGSTERRKRLKVSRDIDLPVAEIQGAGRGVQGADRARRPGKPFPDEPMEQLWGAIAAVFESWNTRRAIDYRKLHDIPDTMGTAVNVVTMVFGNLGEDSGTGVAFTRDPSTGEKGALRRVPAQRPGRGRGLRHPRRRSRSPGSATRCRRPSPSWSGWPGPWSGTSATCRTWSSPSSAASCTCCRPAAAQRTGHAAVRIAVRDGGRRS